MSNLELKGFKGLRGLDSLLFDAHVSDATQHRVQHVPVTHLTPGKYQPRKKMDGATLAELGRSIQSHGILQPLIVRKKDQHTYEIIAGERRWQAAKMAGLREVPVIVRDVDDNVVLAFSLIENIQRENLNPLEEAIAFWRFKAEFDMTHADIANMLGRSRESVTNTMRLVSLAEDVKHLLMEGQLEMGHARALLTLTPEKQTAIAQTIVEKKLSVRDTEKLVSGMRTTGENKKGVADKSNTVFYREKYDYWSAELSKKFLTDVTVKLNEKGLGKIILHVGSPEHIEWLIENLKIE